MLFVRFYCLSELQQFTRLMLAGSEKKLKNNSRDNPEKKRTVSIFSLKLRHCLIKLRKDTRQHFFYIFIKFKQRSHKFKLMLAGDDTRSYIKKFGIQSTQPRSVHVSVQNFIDTSNETLQGTLDGTCAELVTAAIDTLSIPSLAVERSRNR